MITSIVLDYWLNIALGFGKDIFLGCGISD
jgi:hypothetical protein